MVAIRRSRNGGTQGTQGSSITHILITFLLCVVSFYAGALSGIASVVLPSSSSDAICNEKNIHDSSSPLDPKIDSIVQQRVQAELSKAGHNLDGDIVPIFEKSMKNFARGLVRVKKDEFVDHFDYGLPMDKGAGTGEEEVLLFYNTDKALPTQNQSSQRSQIDTGNGLALLNVNEATENCDTMNVVTTSNPGQTSQCLAIVGNYESYHVQRWMRLPHDGGKLSRTEKLRAVSRGHGKGGQRQFKLPSEDNIKQHWEMLKTYLDSLDEVLSELRPIAEKVAIENTIIIMTCNMGQSELLMNFVCNARSRGYSLQNVLLFPTDEETNDLAKSMGLTTFYDSKNFEKLPQGEAKRYADKTFVAMMFAKVVCVQLINMLGYDLLFQDVDIIWYKNPINYFHDNSNPFHDFDMYFQDDGAHSTRYAPLSANSGFYYVRNNERTRYLFTTLLYSGDLIISSHSHQQALVQLLSEHSSLFGLRVKVFHRDTHEFPGGFHYHRRKDFMKKLIKGEIDSEIFHMSWTTNKENKLKFFQQMGEWYLNEKCVGKTKYEISGKDVNSVGSSLIDACCLSEPEVICHYRDKPSKIPCSDKDPIDKGKNSFW